MLEKSYLIQQPWTSRKWWVHKLNQLAGRVSVVRINGMPEDLFLQKVRNAIQARFADHRFKVAALAQALGISQPQLFRKLKARTGQSASMLIRSFRLQQAKALLEQSDLNISEIAYDCGFGSPSHFTHTFTSVFGLPPKAYRAKARK